MEVMVPLPAEEFSFDNTNTVLFSPQGFDTYFFSAPTSPMSPLSIYNYDHDCGDKDDDNNAFAFSIRADSDLPRLSSAEELFDSGKIKPREQNHMKIIQNTLSFGRNNKVSSEPFTVFKENAEDSSSSASSSVGWLRKKWRLKDLLFRSSSEGHESNKSSFLRKFKEDDLKNSSAKKKKSGRAVVALSAHEQHYKVKRAAAEELRKRTFLPYKQNLMIGCVDLAAAGVSDPSRVAIRIR